MADGKTPHDPGATAKKTPDIDDIVKSLKTVIDVIEKVSRLEGELQAQLAKNETRAREDIADELASVIRNRDTLVKYRRKLLGQLQPELLDKVG